MSKTTRELPVTELVERAIQVARVETTNDESRTWGAVNDVYLQELIHQADWNFLLASSSITTEARYLTGTASVNTGATSVTFAGGASIPTALDVGSRIRFNDNANVYEFDRTSATAGTITPALSGATNVVDGAYTLYLPVYALAADFNRFPKGGGLQVWQGAKPTPIPEVSIQEYYDEFTASPAVPSKCRLVAPNTAGVPRVEVGAPPDAVYVLPYDYLYTPPPLRESTAGLTTVAAAATGATFQSTPQLGNVGTGWYFRVDAFGTGADSEWYRIQAVSVAQSSVTFLSTFGTTGANSASYTLCMVPQLPIVLQGALLHGTTKRLLADQSDKTFVYVDSLQTAAVHDAKRLYRTRTYSQKIDTIQSEWDFRR